MKNCYNCGTPNDDNSMACQRCGAPLQMPQQQMQPQMMNQGMQQQMQPGYGMPQHQMQPQMMNQGMPQQMQPGYGMPQQQMQPQMMNPGMQQQMQPGYGMPQQQMQPQMMNQAPQQPMKSTAAPKQNKALIPIIIGVVAVIIIGIIIAVVLGGKDDKDDKDKKPSSYQTKSYKSNDVSSCKTIKTAVETAMTNETAYELLTNWSTGTGSIMVITPGVATEKAGKGIDLHVSGEGDEAARIEIGKNIGEKIPPIKYNYDALTEEEADLVYYVYVSYGGTVYVYIGEKGLEDKIFDAVSSGNTYANGESGYYSICPELCDAYQ